MKTEGRGAACVSLQKFAEIHSLFFPQHPQICTGFFGAMGLTRNRVGFIVRGRLNREA
jgi:hypothetical protein